MTTTQPVNYSVNADAARQVMQSLPRDIADGIFNWKPTLSRKLYNDLGKYQPDTFRMIAPAVTSKPGKPSVKVEALA